MAIDSLVVAAATVVTILEGFAAMGTSVGVCTAAGITAGVLERKSTETITRWAYIGTASGFVLGVPLTICAFVLLAKA